MLIRFRLRFHNTGGGEIRRRHIDFDKFDRATDAYQSMIDVGLECQLVAIAMDPLVHAEKEIAASENYDYPLPF